MVEGYEAFDDPYVYPGTSVMRKVLGIWGFESSPLDTSCEGTYSVPMEGKCPTGNWKH